MLAILAEQGLNAAGPSLQRIFGINKRLFCLFVVSALFCAPVFAIPFKDLYTAEILVPADGSSGVNQNAKAGLLQVLVRVSGIADLASNPTIADALAHPASYYYQYGFDASNRTVTKGDQQVPARVLKIAFEPSAIAGLLRSAGLPVWGNNRPSVLVWIAANDEQGRKILTDAENNPVLQSLQDEALRRGLPLMFPLLDLEDSSSLTTGEVWGLFLDRIDAASARYNPDVVLAARIQQDPSGHWNGSWDYRIDSHWQETSDAADTVDELIDQMVDKLADQLARRYATGSTRTNMTLQVEGINSLADYAAVTAYLQSLTPVIDLNVVDIKGSEAIFQVSSDGQSQQLIQIINLDHSMVLVNAGDDNQPVQYRWVGR